MTIDRGGFYSFGVGHEHYATLFQASDTYTHLRRRTPSYTTLEGTEMEDVVDSSSTFCGVCEDCFDLHSNFYF